jgi:hypothetical protein
LDYKLLKKSSHAAPAPGWQEPKGIEPAAQSHAFQFKAAFVTYSGAPTTSSDVRSELGNPLEFNRLRTAVRPAQSLE